MGACPVNGACQAGSRGGIGSGLKGEVEARTCSGLGIRPDPAAMAEDNPLYSRQPDSGPGKFFFTVEPLENPEEFFRKTHVEARTVVANEVDRSGCAGFRPELDPRIFGAGGILPGIAQQVLSKME